MVKIKEIKTIRNKYKKIEKMLFFELILFLIVYININVLYFATLIEVIVFIVHYTKCRKYKKQFKTSFII